MSVDRIKGLKEALAAASASHDWGLVRSIEQAIQFYETGKNPYGQPPSPPPPPQQIHVNITVNRGTLLKPYPF